MNVALGVLRKPVFRILEDHVHRVWSRPEEGIVTDDLKAGSEIFDSDPIRETLQGEYAEGPLFDWGRAGEKNDGDKHR